jgi:DNA-binding NarL/FixJ family response regulator
MRLVARAATGGEAIQKFREHRPDITLMDLRLPDMSGIDTIIALRTEFPDARIIMLTTFKGDVDIQWALEAGASGYLLKSMPAKDLVAAIRQVHVGRKRIRPEVTARLADHMGGPDCARDRRTSASCRVESQSGHCREALHLGGDSQSSRQPQHGEAGRQ